MRAYCAPTGRADGLFDVRVSYAPAPDAPPLATDAVLVIDTSGSMASPANDAPEMRAFTKLDIAKHAAEIFARGMNAGDSLTVIAFNDGVRIVLPRTAMDDAGKEAAADAIAALVPGGCTALWSALRAGLEAARSPPSDKAFAFAIAKNRVVVLLTDGQPSTSPAAGEEAALRAYRAETENRCRVLAVGFGNDVNSQLLDALGRFVFVSDGSMVIQAFTHLLADELTVVGDLAAVSHLAAVAWQPLRAGARRDALLTLDKADIHQLAITVDGRRVPVADVCVGPEAAAAIAAESARARAMDAVRLALRLGNVDLAKARAAIADASERLRGALAREIDDDLVGQVALALQPQHWAAWGAHYLRALLASHVAQTCANLKDPGLQPYGGSAFRARLAELTALCDTMALPKPSGGGGGGVQVPAMSVAQFSRLFVTAEGGCFGPDGLVLLADGSAKRVCALRPGDVVAAPGHHAGAEIACVVVMEGQTAVARVRDVLVTPNHPVRLAASGGEWTHAKNAEEPRPTSSLAKVYNFVLIGAAPCGVLRFVSEGGAVLFDACTLGHGLTGDVVEHAYLGTSRVVEDLMRFPGWREGRVVLNARNVVRDARGHICRYACDDDVTVPVLVPVPVPIPA